VRIEAADRVSRNFRGIVRLDADELTDDVLRPGMFVRLSLLLEPLVDALLVDSDTVRITAQGPIVVVAEPSADDVEQLVGRWVSVRLLGAEAGVLGALFGLLLVLLTARRAWIRCVDEAGVTQRVAAAVFVAGAVAACLQDALHDVGTALPFWVAVGMIWSPRPREARAWWLGKRSTGVLLGTLGVALALLAWPRLDSQLALRSAYLAIERAGAVDARAVALLEHAQQATPRDPDVADVVNAFAPLAMQRAAQAGDVPLQARLTRMIVAAREARAAYDALSAPRAQQPPASTSR